MSRPFKLKAVLRYLDKGLFASYLKSRDVAGRPDLSDKKDENAAWEKFVQGLPAEQRNFVETDLQDVNDMATESGILALLQTAGDEGLHPQEKIEKLAGSHDQALYFFLELPKVFQSASLLHHVTDLKAKAERYLEKRPAEFVAGKGTVLAQALSEFFLTADGRGRTCEVNPFPNRDRVCFMAYPEDFAHSSLIYEGKKLTKRTLRPTFEIVFIYYPVTGKVELSAKGGPKRQKELFAIFNRVVLEDNRPVPDLEKTYRLESFLDGRLKLPPRPEDNVEHVRLTSLRVAHKFDDYRLTVDLQQASGLSTMQAALEKLKIHPSSFDVRQAEIKMKFPGKGKKGSVTIRLSYPDKCNLNDSPNHLKAKNYLEEWGLVIRKPAEKPSERSGRELSPSAV
jgi:hypothetical protein